MLCYLWRREAWDINLVKAQAVGGHNPRTPHALAHSRPKPLSGFCSSPDPVAGGPSWSRAFGLTPVGSITARML